LGCTVSIRHKGCGKVWGARYTLGARYLPKNTVCCGMKVLSLHSLNLHV
jgi:hypothetical protein